jgi:hypothetical protein
VWEKKNLEAIETLDPLQIAKIPSLVDRLYVEYDLEVGLWGHGILGRGVRPVEKFFSHPLHIFSIPSIRILFLKKKFETRFPKKNLSWKTNFRTYYPKFFPNLNWKNFGKCVPKFLFKGKIGTLKGKKDM